jgi:hypothetical protein
MLELDMATLLSHLDPPIPLKSRDNFAAFHSVYLYTLDMLVNIYPSAAIKGSGTPREGEIIYLTYRI